MTRSLALIASTLTVVLIVAGSSLAFRYGSHSHLTLAAGTAPTVAASTAQVVGHRPSMPVRHRGSHLRREPSCDDQHWKRTLHPAERWIDLRESTLNPASREPTTGAYGLGQLLPETYRNLGLVESASPCAQITAQRRYAAERYGSFRNAKAFWEANRWW